MPLNVSMKVSDKGMDDSEECGCGDCYCCGAQEFRDNAIALVGMEPVKQGDPKNVQREIVKLLEKLPIKSGRKSAPGSDPGAMMGDEDDGGGY